MSDFLTSSTNSTYNDYNRFNHYWIRNLHHETKDTIIKEEKSKKEKVHIFDIKDLDL
jgi:hypothetical protein